jgi:aspartate/tyrosine/aromatic aminotransferase
MKLLCFAVIFIQEKETKVKFFRWDHGIFVVISGKYCVDMSLNSRNLKYFPKHFQ